MKSDQRTLRLVFIAVLVLLGHPHRASWVVGAALLGLGVLLRGWAVGHRSREGTLTTSGPYALVRNPIVIADLLRDVGLLLACHGGNEQPVVWLVASLYFAWMYLGLVRRAVLTREEPRLARSFGPAYEEYTRHVPRFLPRLTPGLASEGVFRSERILQCGEWRRLLVPLMLIVATYYRWEFFHHGFVARQVLDDPWETSLVLSLVAGLVMVAVQIGRIGWYASVPRVFGSAIHRARDFLAALPLLYALVSIRWEWEWDPGIWGIAVLLCIVGGAVHGLVTQRGQPASDGLEALSGGGTQTHLRNPHFLGNVLIIAGAGIASELAWLVPAGTAWAFTVYTLAARYEEQCQLERHGRPFEEYAARVPRWLPHCRILALDVQCRRFVGAALRQSWRLAALLPFAAKELNLLGLGS